MGQSYIATTQLATNVKGMQLPKVCAVGAPPTIVEWVPCGCKNLRTSLKNKKGVHVLHKNK